MKTSALLHHAFRKTSILTAATLLLLAGHGMAAQKDSYDPKKGVEAFATFGPAATGGLEFTDLEIYTSKSSGLESDDHTMTADVEERERVPEPSSFVLTGFGMTILLLRRKR